MIVISYLKAAFNDNSDFKYYLQLVLILLILGYQLFYVIGNLNVGKGRINLIIIYHIFIVFQYLILISGLEKLILLSALVINLLLYSKYPLKQNELKKLYYFFVFVALLKILNGTTVANMSDKSKFNPNECAVTLMVLFCISLVRFVVEKRFVSLIICSASIILQFIFTSRGAMAGCLLFLGFFLALRAWRKPCKSKTAFWIIFVLSVFGILVAYFYAEVLFKMIGNGNVIIFGKDLFTGRQVIWELTFDSIRNNFWFGVGNKLNESYAMIHNNSVYTNAHNQALGVLAAFGIIHFIFFYFIFSKIISSACAFTIQRKKYIPLSPLLFICIITLMNYFEIIFFSQWAIPLVIVGYGYICNCRFRITIKIKTKKRNFG